MPTTVDIPNLGEVEFPDSMSTSDIEREASKLHFQANPPAMPNLKVPGLTDAAEAFKGGQPITQQEGETFQQTMQRAAAAGKTVSPEEVTGQTIEGVKDLPYVPVAAAGAAVAPIALGEAGAATPTLVKAAIPPTIALGKWANANPVKAYILFNLFKEVIPGAAKASKYVKSASTAGGQ